MQSKSKTILSILQVLSWIIFLGLCIKTGALLYSFFVSLVINTAGAQNLYPGLDLSALLQQNRGQYVNLVVWMIVLSGMKAYLFYQVIKIFLKANLVQPFSKEVAELIGNISYFAFSIGFLSVLAKSYTQWLSKRVGNLPDLQDYIGGGVELLLLACVIYVIAQVFNKGIEIQSENELTI